nr:MAG TPA: hypothetical protein [Bacteriophage sp.]
MSIQPCSQETTVATFDNSFSNRIMVLSNCSLIQNCINHLFK